MLLVSLMLTACGGNATTTPVPAATAKATTVAATTAVSTTAKATTVAATTAKATTVAATTVAATTAKATTVAATTAASSKSAVTLPTITGATEIALDPALSAELSKQTDLSNPVIKFYVSDDAADKLADNANSTITGAGWITMQDKPEKQKDNSFTDYYVKMGFDDILLISQLVPVSATTNDLSKLFNVTVAEAQKLADQVKGKKSMVLLAFLPDTTTPEAATTAATTAAASSADTVTLPTITITGATEIAVAPVLSAELPKHYYINNAISKLYVSDDAADKLADNADIAITGAGWTSLQDKPGKQEDNSFSGDYGKYGSYTIYLRAIPIPVPATADALSKLFYVTVAEAQKLADQIKGKKNMVLIAFYRL
jgi:superoxide dismutase